MGTLEGGEGGCIAFVTGTLAAPLLESILGDLSEEVGFEYEIVRLRIDVAALMTTEWIARRLELSERVERVLIPGYVRGDVERLTHRIGRPVERGPKDLRALPEHFGRGTARTGGYGSYSIEILAEINHVPDLSERELLAEARRFAEQGADVIDLGCNPGEPFAEIRSRVELLRAEGLRVSIDSLHEDEIRAAVAGGAELVLSVNRSNLEVARDLGAEVVIIPDRPSAPDALDQIAETASSLDAWGVEYRLDPVLEPIGFGFAASLGRYVAVRERFPTAAVMMGIGNLTELTDADSAPINLLLAGFCEELQIASVLTTGVIHWATDSVREIDLARRLVRYAVENSALPKHVEPRLHLVRDATHREPDPAELSELAQRIRDRNFRLYVAGGELHALSAGRHLHDADAFELFRRLDVSDPSHAFYLGYELAKATTALTLGKNYVQDEALSWGFLTRPEESHLDRNRSGRGEAEER